MTYTATIYNRGEPCGIISARNIHELKEEARKTARNKRIAGRVKIIEHLIGLTMSVNVLKSKP